MVQTQSTSLACPGTPGLPKVIYQKKEPQGFMKVEQGIGIFSGILILDYSFYRSKFFFFSFKNNQVPDLLPNILPRVAQEDHVQDRCLKVKGSA